LLDGGHDPNDGRLTERPQFNLTGSLKNAITHKPSPADGYIKPIALLPLEFNMPKAMSAQVAVSGATALWAERPHWSRTINTDLGVLKHFNVTERQPHFEANFFNLFNHTNFDNRVVISIAAPLVYRKATSSMVLRV